jgi:hypothetical protein
MRRWCLRAIVLALDSPLRAAKRRQRIARGSVSLHPGYSLSLLSSKHTIFDANNARIQSNPIHTGLVFLGRKC